MAADGDMRRAMRGENPLDENPLPEWLTGKSADEAALPPGAGAEQSPARDLSWLDELAAGVETGAGGESGARPAALRDTNSPARITRVSRLSAAPAPDSAHSLSAPPPTSASSRVSAAPPAVEARPAPLRFAFRRRPAWWEDAPDHENPAHEIRYRDARSRLTGLTPGWLRE